MSEELTIRWEECRRAAKPVSLIHASGQALTDGALVPSHKQTMSTSFTITVTPPEGAPDGSKPITIKFHVEQANTLSPKA